MSSLQINELLNEYELSDLLKSIRNRKIEISEDDKEGRQLYQDFEEALGNLTKRMVSIIDHHKSLKGEKTSKEEESGSELSQYTFKSNDGIRLLKPEKPIPARILAEFLRECPIEWSIYMEHGIDQLENTSYFLSNKLDIQIINSHILNYVKSDNKNSSTVTHNVWIIISHGLTL